MPEMTQQGHINTAATLLQDAITDCVKALRLSHLGRLLDARELVSGKAMYKLRIACDALSRAEDCSE